MYKKQSFVNTKCKAKIYCIFANEGDQYLNQTLTLQTKENYNDLNDSDGMFLGLIVENNTVKRGFVCGTNEDVLFCLEGGVDESESDDKPIYRKNIDILNHFYPNCDLTYDSSEVYCGIAAVYDDGRIELGDQYVYIHDNYAYCAYQRKYQLSSTINLVVLFLCS